MRYQVLIYPVTNCEFHSPFYLEFAEGYWPTRENMQFCWDHYLTDPADAHDPHASVLRAHDLGRLPPAMLISAECDCLRDEVRVRRTARESGRPSTTASLR
jgi:acetyl esterase